jgi:hypothetical protein
VRGCRSGGATHRRDDEIIEESLGRGLDLLQPSDTPIDFLPQTSQGTPMETRV